MTEVVYVVIPSDAFLRYLRRAAAGESPDVLAMEFWANAEHERIEAGE